MKAVIIRQWVGFSGQYGIGETAPAAFLNNPRLKRSKPFMLDVYEVEKLSDVDVNEMGGINYMPIAKHIVELDRV